ncbi:MAG: FecR domain-containing protein [Candidatus Nanoarchaeia archaeon]
MEKSYVLGGILIAILFLGGFGYWYVTGSYTRTAFLNVESGQVQVDTGSGWTGAADGMDLSINDKVKTGAGEASVVLYESIIIAIESNSIISIKDLSKAHPKVEHTLGSTWNKFTGLTGIDAFTIETPNTVATVRGTEFGSDMDGVMVAEGNVDVKREGKDFDVQGGFKVVEVDGETVKIPLSPEERAKVVTKMKKTMKLMQNLRMQEIHKKEFAYSQVKSMYDMTDSDVEGYLARADRGEFDLDEVSKKAPFEIAVMEKVKALTEEVRKQNRLIATFEQQ